MKKAAVIGLGDISPIHLAAIAGNPDIELCAVCDIDPEAGQRAPEGVPFTRIMRRCCGRQSRTAYTFVCRITCIIPSRNILPSTA
ncbi:MAG: hypothetical protein V8T36_10710 [Ruthenibacterium lactatiformans]